MLWQAMQCLRNFICDNTFLCFISYIYYTQIIEICQTIFKTFINKKNYYIGIDIYSYNAQQKDTERLEKIVNQVEEKESSYNSYMKYDKQIEDISNLGKQKIIFTQ